MQIFRYLTDDYRSSHRNEHTSSRLIQHCKLSITQSHRTSCTAQFAIPKRKQQMTCTDQTHRFQTCRSKNETKTHKRNQLAWTFFNFLAHPRSAWIFWTTFFLRPKKKYLGTTTVFRRPLTESRTEIPISANNNNHIKANVATLTASLS